MTQLKPSVLLYVAIFSCLLFCFSQANGQASTIRAKGTVTDSKTGDPLPGATVREVGGKKSATQTDAGGRFELLVPVSSKLQITMVGYKMATVDVLSTDSMAIGLDTVDSKMNDVVVIGYTQQKKELFTGAVTTVNVTQGMNELPVPSAADLLSGKVAGVDVSNNPGRPGTQNSVSIRTGTSWNSQPVLYVIDGMLRDSKTFQNLAPNEIESMTVLKDASSAAIYGVRSDGGVIVVTTKRGSSGKPTINYTFNYSGDHPTQEVPLTNLYQNGLLVNQMYANVHSIDPRIPAEAPQGTGWSEEELNWAKGLPGQGYDALGAVWRTPFIMTHGISITGGSDKIKYFASANYFDQGGFMKSTDYKKWNARLNLTADITSNLQLYAGLALTSSNTASAPIEGTDATYLKLRASFNMLPTFSDQGDRYIASGWAYGSAAAEADGLIGYQHTNYIDPQATVSLTYKLPWVEGLSLKASYMGNWSNEHYKEYDAHATFWFPILSGDNNHIVDADNDHLTTTFTNTNFQGLYSTAKWQNNYQLNFQASYTRDFGKHHVDAALVFEKAQSSFSSIWNQNQGFPVYQTDQYWAANNNHDNMWSGGGPDYKSGRASYIGQVNYTYTDKYLLNLSLREDGSMYFAPNERWGLFPAASAGWVMTKEDFLKDSRILTYLKPRVAMGVTGNDAVVSGWQWQQIYQNGNTYFFGDPNPSTSVGIKYGSLVNPDLTWEKSLSYNLGFDYEFIHHLSGSFNFWFKHTYDILGTRQNSLPTTFSRSMPQQNYGVIDAHGYELTIGWHQKTGDIDWSATLNASYGTNKVVKEDYPVSYLSWQVPEGKPTNHIAGYTSYIIRTQAELEAFQKANPDYINPGNGNTAVGLGSMVYVDRSGPEGKPDGQINDYDQTILYANTNPVILGLDLSAKWKGFSFEAVFTGNLHNTKSFYELGDYYGGQMYNTRWQSEAYTPENPNAPLPMVVPRDYRSYSISNSSFWYQSASFLRLQNLNIGYTFNFDKPLGNAIKSVRVFTSATNLFYISKFKYWDPELNPAWSGIGYPIMRTFSGGVNVNF